MPPAIILGAMAASLAATAGISAYSAVSGKPDAPDKNSTEAAPELKAEDTKAQFEADRQKLKAARRVSTILSGPGGVEEEVSKSLAGRAVLLGKGK